MTQRTLERQTQRAIDYSLGSECGALWSLTEMHNYAAPIMLIVMRDLTHVIADLMVISSEFGGTERMVDHRGDHLDALMHLEEESRQLKLSYAVRDQLDRTLQRVREEDFLTVDVARELLKTLQNSLLADMVDRWFLEIPAQHRRLYLEPANQWGQRVVDGFPDALYDIEEAGRCIALNRWTALVFHLMRVAEHGLRRLASLVDEEMADEIELQQWKTIIERIEKRVRAWEQEPRTPEREHRIERYSQAAAHAYLFKNAWRNHVMHSRRSYDESSAMSVWRQVNEFMQAVIDLPA